MEKRLSWWLALPTEKPLLSSFLAGILLGAAFPPVSLSWGIWLAFPLLWDLARRQRPYRYLYIALLIWNFLGCYWLMLTALSAPNLWEGIVSFLAGLVAILVNPLLMLLPFFLWRRIHGLIDEPGWSPWSFVILWSAFEYLHFRWELTWSWLNIGFAWSEWSYWRSLASLFGVVGLSTWSLIGAAFLYQKRLVPFLVWGLVFPLLGVFFIASPSPSAERQVYAIQPNIDPYVKFSEFSPEAQVAHMLRLLPSHPSPYALIVLPETTIPVGVSVDKPLEEPLLRPFYEYVRRHQVNLLIGIIGYKYFQSGSSAPVSARLSPDGGAYEAYNAALLLRPDTIQLHIKSRLVPFVERVPYLETLTLLKKWNIDLGGNFGNLGKPADQKALTLFPDEVPVAVAICYESIFVHDLRRRLPSQPALLAIITNDGWWKRSSGHWQHLVYGQLNAAALGVAAVRSANTGVSALFSPGGVRLRDLGYNKTGSIEGSLPLIASRTLYYKVGEISWLVLNTFALILWIRQWYRSRRSSMLSEK